MYMTPGLWISKSVAFFNATLNVNAMNRCSLLLHQFLFGCDLLECDNQYCARNPSFCHRNLSRTAREDIARTSPSTVPICHYLPTIISYPASLPGITYLDSWARSIIRPGRVDHSLSRTILSDSFDIFPLLLLSGDGPLSFRQSLIDDFEMEAFAVALSSHGALSSAILSFLRRIVSTLQQTDLYSFQTIRLLFIALYFPPLRRNSDLVTPLLHFFCAPKPYVRHTFQQWLTFLPRLTSLIVGLCRQTVDGYPYHVHVGPRCEMLWVFTAMKTLYDANELAAERLPIRNFYWEKANANLIPLHELTKNHPFWHDYPFLLSLRRKAEFCELQSNAIMEMALELAFREGMQEAILTRSREIMVNPWFTMRSGN
jgi:hypothetical protein